MCRRRYRIALYNANDDVIEGAHYMHVSEETPTRGLPIELPQGNWFVHEVLATWSEDKSSQLDGSHPHYGGTLICHPDPPFIASRFGGHSRSLAHRRLLSPAEQEMPSLR